MLSLKKPVHLKTPVLTRSGLVLVTLGLAALLSACVDPGVSNPTAGPDQPAATTPVPMPGAPQQTPVTTPVDPDVGLALHVPAQVILNADSPSVTLQEKHLSFTNGRTLRMTGLSSPVTSVTDVQNRLLTLQLNAPVSSDHNLTAALEYVASDGTVLLSAPVQVQVRQPRPYKLQLRATDALLIPKVDLWVRYYQEGSNPRRYGFTGKNGSLLTAGIPMSVPFGGGWVLEYITPLDLGTQNPPVWTTITP